MLLFDEAENPYLTKLKTIVWVAYATRRGELPSASQSSMSTDA
jgi:hypothetical protein